MEDRVIKFQGFHPSDFTRTYLDDKVSALLDEAPYGATLDATFTRKDHDFKGIVNIHSPAGQFFAVATGTRLKDVTRKLLEQLRKQLGKWKEQRFAGASA